MNSLVLLFIAFFVVSGVFMAFGQGGGSIYVPLLLAFGLPFYKASATSQVLIMVATLSAFLIYQKAGFVDWWLALIVEPPTNLGAFFGGYFSHYFSPRLSKLLFSGILLLGAYFMLRPVKEKSVSKRSWYHLVRPGRDSYTLNVLVVVPVMAFAGFLAGMLGIGGGIFKVPAMVLLGGVPIKVAVGTSSLMVGVTAFTGLLGHALVGHFDARLSAILALAVFSGAQLGARVGVKVEKGKHRRYFAYLLMFISAWMAYSALK